MAEIRRECENLASARLVPYITIVASVTMNINALVISGSDPGAVPGVSTITAHLASEGTK